MEVETASEIAEACGCYFKFDDTMKTYKLYVGTSWAYIKPEDFAKVDEKSFIQFLYSFMQQEVEDVRRYGGPIKH